MQYPPVVAGANPFGVLTAIVAPAILTNACSVLALGTSNRLARVVDRTRVVTAGIASGQPDSEELRGWNKQFRALQKRAQMLLLALRLIYAALGLFATTALISVGGSVAAFYGLKVFQIEAMLALATGAFAVAGLTVGCYLMVHETRLAIGSLGEEARMTIWMHDPDKLS